MFIASNCWFEDFVVGVISISLGYKYYTYYSCLQGLLFLLNLYIQSPLKLHKYKTHSLFGCPEFIFVTQTIQTVKFLSNLKILLYNCAFITENN